MKNRFVILVLIGLISCMTTTGCEKQNGAETDQATKTWSSASAGEYVTTYSNIPGPLDSLAELGMKGPYYINMVTIGEESIGEELANVYFTKDSTFGSGANPKDTSTYGVEITKNAEGTPVSIKVSSNAANDFMITAYYHTVDKDLPAYFRQLRSDDGVHSSDGAVIPNPYDDPDLSIAGGKELNFKCNNEDGDKIRNKLEEAGYPTFSKIYSKGTYTISTIKELDGRAKIYENILKSEDWVLDKEKSKGNIGFYNKAGDYAGEITINWTLSNIPFTIKIKDAKLEMLENAEDETNYTMSGTAEIQEKSFQMGDMVYRLKDKQKKPFSEEYDFKVVKEPELAVMWDYVETWEYIDDAYGTMFLVTVVYTTRNGPADLSAVPVESLDNIDGTDTMSFMAPAYSGTAVWSFEPEK